MLEIRNANKYPTCIPRPPLKSYTGVYFTLPLEFFVISSTKTDRYESYDLEQTKRVLLIMHDK